MNNKIDVFNEGYVRLVDSMGDDLSIVNAARVSFDKESNEFNEKDDKLIKFLLRRNETSPFRHAVLSFECYAPLMTARQWWKYQIASTHADEQNGWNESSRRYITEEPTFYIPDRHSWRLAPENKKQGSSRENLDEYSGGVLTSVLLSLIERAEDAYNEALKWGVAPEQARLFLPAYGMYVRWRWTASVAAVLWFLMQRLEDKAQDEIRQYAKAVLELTKLKFPATIEAFLEELDGG